MPVTDSHLVFEFAEPRDIGRIRILGGRTEGDEARTLFARPRVVELQRRRRAVHATPCVDDVGELFEIEVDFDDVETVTDRHRRHLRGRAAERDRRDLRDRLRGVVCRVYRAPMVPGWAT